MVDLNLYINASHAAEVEAAMHMYELCKGSKRFLGLASFPGA